MYILRQEVPLVLALALAAHAAPDGFEHVRDALDCRVWMRPEAHPDGASMRAECEWPEVDPVHLADLLGQYERYSEYVFPIAVARVEAQRDDRVLVYQRQELFGLADREVLLWMSRLPVEGGVRFAWTAAHEQPLELRPGAIRTPRNTGFWEIVGRADGGTLVVHEIALDAGGSVPRWIVNLVRTRSFLKIMGDVREIARRGDDVGSARAP